MRKRQLIRVGGCFQVSWENCSVGDSCSSFIQEDGAGRGDCHQRTPAGAARDHRAQVLRRRSQRGEGRS